MKQLRKLISSMPILALWLIVWGATLAVHFLPSEGVLVIAFLSWLVALILAPGRFQGWRLLKAAALFLATWLVLLALGQLFWPSSWRSALNLAAYVALGLILILAKTPLQWAWGSSRLLAPLLGEKRAQKLALALALLARQIPSLIQTALSLKKTIDRRASHLPFQRRLSLWARTFLRESFHQAEELALTLTKRL